MAIVTHADGRHLERLEIDRAAWIAAPAPAAEYAQRPGESRGAALPRSDPARQAVLPGARPVSDRLVAGVRDGGGAGRASPAPRRAESMSSAGTSGREVPRYGPDGRTIGSASYVYRRFPRAQLFGQVASTWRLEQRIESDAGELLRLERKRSAAVGVVFPWTTLRRTTLFSASARDRGPASRERRRRRRVSAADPIRQDPTLVGGGLGLSFGNTQAGLRSISVQDGVRMSASIDYLEATAGDRWRSGWEVAASVYRSFPSWTTAGRPVLAATARIAEQRGPAAGRLTAGGVGTTAVLDAGGSDFEVRGYPPGFVAASALWSARAEMRLPIARVSRGLGALPLYLRGLSGSWFIDSVGAASRVDRLGSPQLLSTGAELSSDITLFSFLPIRIRTGVGVPLKSLGPVSRGDARFYVTAGTSF